MNSIVPQHIGTLLDILRKAGHKGYIAGGAVRDLLLGLTPKDYDIATDALTEEVGRIMIQAGLKVIDGLGRNYGVAVVIISGQAVEIATFRGERYGQDSHRPEEVWFETDIYTDLSRRDFTINAMALDHEGNLTDPFDGQADLAAGFIRTVGEPGFRFAEDSLRMFRACRFAAQLGFRVDPFLLAVIPNNLYRVAGLSLERVRNEIEKTLLAKFPSLGLEHMLRSGLFTAHCRTRINHQEYSVAILPELTHLVDLRQNRRYHRYDAWRHSLVAVNHTPSDLTLRWAALLHDVGKGMPEVRGCNREGQPTDFGHDRLGSVMAGDILRRLGVRAGIAKRAKWIVSRHMRFGFHMGHSCPVWQHWVREEARSGLFHSCHELQDAFRQLVQICVADVAALNSTAEDLEACRVYGEALIRLAAGMPVHTSDLKISGREVLPLLPDKNHIAHFMKVALRRTQDGNLLNERDALYLAAIHWSDRHSGENGGSDEEGKIKKYQGSCGKHKSPVGRETFKERD